MKFPYLFREIHGSLIFNEWMRNKQPLYVRVVPQEPLGRVSFEPPNDVTLGDTVTIVTVRCWNDRGTMQFEAATPTDLKVAEEWAKRHKETPPEAFKWIPLLPPLKSP